MQEMQTEVDVLEEFLPRLFPPPLTAYPIQQPRSFPPQRGEAFCDQVLALHFLQVRL
jgi:hypothetical protein